MASKLSKIGTAFSKQSRGTQNARQRSAVDRLTKLVELIVAESGNPEKFDARMWVREWIVNPNPALGGRKPASLMNNKEGQAIIFSLISQMQSGAYA
ncbi:MbcA/ParS/Xre antitoxin family protein [Herbaspirillum sp. RV1423]|uniref:MbcA/ParS/Xre antitoxin family protein n=1 Tax=Herbaspirillum sp. RV1423 TaxID=1443993 RepID=UPI00068402D6|nr:MbcA/ParS/Xre antitoxin family protein [Herbaspirillum sp. RV1423]